MNQYIRGSIQFVKAHMAGRSEAWRDGYLAAFYGKGNEDCDGKSDEYIAQFTNGYNHFCEIMRMNSWANRLRKEDLLVKGRVENTKSERN